MAEKRASELGYKSVADYLVALADEDPDVIEAGFREGWHDVMTGRVYPVAKLSDLLEDNTI